MCMPRHPPNALTSRLRVHTTNDRAASLPAREIPNRRAATRTVAGADNLLSIEYLTRSRLRLARPQPKRSCPRRNPKPLAASISKTHSQCQRRNPLGFLHCEYAQWHTRKLVIFIPGDMYLPQPRITAAGNWWSLSGSNR